MKQFGLIGFPLSHSFSKQYFEEKFLQLSITDCRYDLFPIESVHDFPKLLSQHPALAGLNVTIPYKETIIPFLDELSEEAEEIGAVNCIRIQHGKTKGFNTDVWGFENSLNTFLSQTKPIQIKGLTSLQTFVLGSGGSAKAVEYVLHKMKIPYQQVSRTISAHKIGYADIETHLGSSNLFINATPQGMYPHIDSAPAIPYHLLSQQDFLFDLIYNPTETEFLKRGKAYGAQIQNGWPMLQMQADKSWEIWTA